MYILLKEQEADLKGAVSCFSAGGVPQFFMFTGSPCASCMRAVFFEKEIDRGESRRFNKCIRGRGPAGIHFSAPPWRAVAGLFFF